MTTKLNGEFKLISGKLFYVMVSDNRYVRIRCYRSAWKDWYAESQHRQRFIEGLDRYARIRAA